jgi:hypothetical protein
MALARYESILLTITSFYVYFILFFLQIKTVRVAVLRKALQQKKLELLELMLSEVTS